MIPSTHINLGEELGKRNITQRVMSEWWYEALYAYVNRHKQTIFTFHHVYQELLILLGGANMISSAMMEPMSQERMQYSILKRCDYILKALEHAGDIMHLDRGRWELTGTGASMMLKHRARDARLAYAKRIIDLFDQHNKLKHGK